MKLFLSILVSAFSFLSADAFGAGSCSAIIGTPTCSITCKDEVDSGGKIIFKRMPSCSDGALVELGDSNLTMWTAATCICVEPSGLTIPASTEKSDYCCDVYRTYEYFSSNFQMWRKCDYDSEGYSLVYVSRERSMAAQNQIFENQGPRVCKGTEFATNYVRLRKTSKSCSFVPKGTCK